jgi:geranylgeranyl diphosphate synthase, type I
MTFAESHKRYLEIINKELDNFLNKEISSLNSKEPFIKECYELIREYTLMGGKRLRPFALVISYLACGGKEERKAFLPAVAVELHQTYSLILDDIMDEDEFRRGRPGVNKKLKDYFLKNFKEESYNGLLFNKKSSKFIASYAMMLGNLANILSKKAILSSNFNDEIKTKAMFLIEKADEQIYHGQMMDIKMENNKNTSEIEYLEMIKLKTAAFFGMAFELGALFSGADEYKRQLFKEFGTNIAMSFQIQDDIIDITMDKGRELGSDIKKAKKTLLMLKTSEKADNYEKKILFDVCGKQDASEREISKVIDIMHDAGAIIYCKNLALHYNKEAKDILRKMKLDLYHSLLLSDMADFMIKRNY